MSRCRAGILLLVDLDLIFTIFKILLIKLYSLPERFCSTLLLTENLIHNYRNITFCPRSTYANQHAVLSECVEIASKYFTTGNKIHM